MDEQNKGREGDGEGGESAYFIKKELCLVTVSKRVVSFTRRRPSAELPLCILLASSLTFPPMLAHHPPGANWTQAPEAWGAAQECHMLSLCRQGSEPGGVKCFGACVGRASRLDRQAAHSPIAACQRQLLSMLLGWRLLLETPCLLLCLSTH